MLFVRLVCKPSTAALVVSRVPIGQINTVCSTVGPASPAPTGPSETKDLQQGLLEEKPLFCHRCHNSAQLIYCFLSPSLQFQSYHGPVVVCALWLGDLNQDQFLSSASKGRRSGFIRNSMWAFWAKPVLWKTSATASRENKVCSHVRHIVMGSAEPGQARAQTGLTWCSASWVSGEGDTTKQGMDQMF